MTKQVLILGGAGFVGSSLAVGLKVAHPEWGIACFDNLRRRGSELNLPRLRGHGISFVHGDIRSATDLDVEPLGAPNIVVDCSAEPSVLAGVTSPQYVVQANLLGTANVLEFCRQTSAQLLFLSTSRVYSVPALRGLRLVEQPTRFCLAPDQPEAHVTGRGIGEEFPTKGFRSLYGTTKLASEMLIEEYRESFGLKAIVNRCGVLTGPWQMGKVDQGVFVLWMAAHYFRKSLAYIGFGGTGKQVRDLLHIDDLLELVKYQLERFDELAGDLFNVGGGLGCSLSLLETTELCQEMTGHNIEIKMIKDERPADVALFITDSSKVMKRTGWQPKQTPRSTLQDIYRWIQQEEASLRAVLS
jgi:CDP-paratose 2-epimerase